MPHEGRRSRRGSPARGSPHSAGGAIPAKRPGGKGTSPLAPTGGPAVGRPVQNCSRLGPQVAPPVPGEKREVARVGRRSLGARSQRTPGGPRTGGSGVPGRVQRFPKSAAMGRDRGGDGGHRALPSAGQSSRASPRLRFRVRVGEPRAAPPPPARRPAARWVSGVHAAAPPARAPLLWDPSPSPRPGQAPPLA